MGVLASFIDKDICFKLMNLVREINSSYKEVDFPVTLFKFKAVDNVENHLYTDIS